MNNIEKQDINKPIGTIKQETIQGSMNKKIKEILFKNAWIKKILENLQFEIAEGFITEEEVAKIVKSEILKGEKMWGKRGIIKKNVKEIINKRIQKIIDEKVKETFFKNTQTEIIEKNLQSEIAQGLITKKDIAEIIKSEIEEARRMNWPPKSGHF